MSIILTETRSQTKVFESHISKGKKDINSKERYDQNLQNRQSIDNTVCDVNVHQQKQGSASFKDE